MQQLFLCHRSSRQVCGISKHRTHSRSRAFLRPNAVKSLSSAEQQVFEAIASATGRGKDGIDTEQQQKLETAVQELEKAVGVNDPTNRPDILDGRWQLLYTSRPGTASPIQRAFTGTEAFKIFQEVQLGADDDCRVSNVVEFGDDAKIGILRVEAEASTDSRPLEGFTPRCGTGLAIFGKSQTGPPVRKHMRIDFQFDKAAFEFRALPFKIPYPVPFKLLGDETKGWIDTTYLNKDGSFRLARGNKGTLFVLKKKKTTPVDELLVAIRDRDESRIFRLVNELKAAPPVSAPAKSAIIKGKWRLLWSKAGESANGLQTSLVGQVQNLRITQNIEDTALENTVDFGLAKVRAPATCKPIKDTRTQVIIDSLFAEVLGLRIPIPISRDGAGYVDWLYVDDRLRISKGNRGSTFVHVREGS